MKSATASAASAHTITRPASVIQRAKPFSQAGMLLGSAFFFFSDLSSLKRSDFCVCVPPRSGSARTFSTSALTCARVGAEAGSAALTFTAHSASESSTAPSAALERTAKLLLDVPGFQLHTAVEVHRKARRHVE